MLLPQITPDDRIIMDLQVNQDTLSGTVVNGTPAINTRHISTQVLVKNGETVVLGGVYIAHRIESQWIEPHFLATFPMLDFYSSGLVKVSPNRNC